jgi:hypothetical protein
MPNEDDNYAVTNPYTILILSRQTRNDASTGE